MTFRDLQQSLADIEAFFDVSNELQITHVEASVFETESNNCELVIVALLVHPHCGFHSLPAKSLTI